MYGILGLKGKTPQISLSVISIFSLISCQEKYLKNLSPNNCVPGCTTC